VSVRVLRPSNANRLDTDEKRTKLDEVEEYNRKGKKRRIGK